ncbi:Fic family protein [Arthrobacter sp. NPDC090010]|uniref:Fic family protein n=1 Tax=Arthrobacter sp. NPDC090010 TaxID=3363942 RepID=UPI003802301E
MLYEETHQWLSFAYNPRVNTLWARLGEAFSKNQHLAGIPLPPRLAAELASVVLTKGALATAAIEGNTLSLEEANHILHEGKELPPSQEYLETEIKNVMGALRAVDESGRSGQSFLLSPEWLKEQNAKILDGLEVDDHVVPGEYTTKTLLVGSVYRGAPPAEVPYLVERMCSWLNESFIKPSQDPDTPADMRFYNAVFAAVLAHLYLVWIHPFGDGNGRTARLAEVAVLAHSGVVPWLASNLLSDHYNRTRSAYYRRLDAASKKNDIDGFLKYAIDGYVDMLREQIEAVKGHQMRAAWINYVHEVLHDEPSGTARDRRRELVLAMPTSDPVSRKEIRRLTPILTELYAGHEDRIIARDLNALDKLGLVERLGGGYIARAHIMNAFLPLHG